MRNLLVCLLLVCFVFGCSKTDQNLSPTTDVLSEEYENSNFGNYKGVFTTLDSETRATVDVSITPDGAKATLKTEGGQIHEFFSMAEIEEGVPTEAIFQGDEGSFKFSVGADGSDVEITEVVYLDKPADILAKKNTAKSPTNTFTGTYNCTNCEMNQDADTHPHFTDNSVTETFSFVFSGTAGSGSINTQITYDGNVYNTGSGSEGAVNGAVTGSPITMDNDASDNIVSIGGTSTVLANVDWEGTHDFTTATAAISGYWDFATGGYIMTGVFQASASSTLSLPFSEQFNQTGAGIDGPCTGTDIFTCNEVELPTNGQWIIAGDATGIMSSGLFKVVSNRLRASNIDVPLCFKTKVIDISSGPVNFSVDFLGDTDNDDANDYADVNLILDGTSSMIPNWMGQGSGSHTLVGNFGAGTGSAGTATVTSNAISGSTLQVEICVVVTTGTEQINIDNVAVVAN